MEPMELNDFTILVRGAVSAVFSDMAMGHVYPEFGPSVRSYREVLTAAHGPDFASSVINLAYLTMLPFVGGALSEVAERN